MQNLDFSTDKLPKWKSTSYSIFVIPVKLPTEPVGNLEKKFKLTMEGIQMN